MIEYADDKLTKRYRKQFEKSKEEIRSSLKDKERATKVPKDLFDQLDVFLDAKKRKLTVYLSVDDSPEGPRWGYSGGYCIWIRPASLMPGRKNGVPRLTAVLFHELIHVAGGWELDAEYFENLFFSEGEGATRPTYDDWPEFKADKFEGWWLYLDTRTGHAMDLWKNDLGKFMKAVKPKKGVKLASK